MKTSAETTNLAFFILCSLFTVLCSLSLSLSAAVPHRWAVETTRVQPEQIEAYKGEEIALEATLNAYGKPLETPLESPVYLYWQTNGMGAVYWVTNATVAASNVLAASFLSSFTPEANAVQGFIGSPSSSYRASFVIRFRPSPGATPNVLPLPTQTINFDTITVYNPPYYSKAEVDEKVADATPTDYADVKSKANSALQSESDPNFANWRDTTNTLYIGQKAKGVAIGANTFGADNYLATSFDADHIMIGSTYSQGTVTGSLLSDILAEATPSDYDTVKANASTAKAQSETNKADISTVTAVVQTWESFLDGSNVVFSITNYISGAYSAETAKLRILEMRDGEYVEVYNSRTEITNHLEKAKAEIATAMDEAVNGKADKAWGKYTSAGGEAPSNTVYMTAPNTVFAGGMEYQRVAVGEGSVCVLVTKGAPVWTQGNEGVFKFQDDGGTNYFGFAKTDSYTVGADTDGISVANNIVTLTYNVTMSGVPVIWYTPSLTAPITWEQLNLPDGTAIEGASKAVSWEASPDAGTEVCYINCAEAQGFFKATIEVAGSAKFMTNMPADLSGGILCTDGAHKVKIDYNNGNPKLVVVE